MMKKKRQETQPKKKLQPKNLKILSKPNVFKHLKDIRLSDYPDVRCLFSPQIFLFGAFLYKMTRKYFPPRSLHRIVEQQSFD